MTARPYVQCTTFDIRRQLHLRASANTMNGGDFVSRSEMEKVMRRHYRKICDKWSAKKAACLRFIGEKETGKMEIDTLSTALKFEVRCDTVVVMRPSRTRTCRRLKYEYWFSPKRTESVHGKGFTNLRWNFVNSLLNRHLPRRCCSDLLRSLLAFRHARFFARGIVWGLKQRDLARGPQRG